MTNSIKNDAGFTSLALRLVIGWTYFSAFWRRTVLVDKLDPELSGYIGEKFNHFLPNALGIKPIIQYLVENPDILWWNMVGFTIIEGIVGLFIMFGLFTRLMSIGVIALALGILLGSGWIGTTCLDEWQIGVLGIAGGFVLFITGSGKFSVDNYMISKNFAFTHRRWFSRLASGELQMKSRSYSKLVLFGSLSIFALTLATNQIFHGGVWGTLHNKSVKPKLELSEGIINHNKLSFDVYRTEGVDVYGSWVISIELLNKDDEIEFILTHSELANLSDANISNYYIAKVKPGKHSLVVPLGAKAKISFNKNQFSELPPGKYTLKLTDISGAFWEHQIEKQ